jgi:uncharacterized protein (TIGR00255 family)
MISMTGYGKASLAKADYEIEIEVKSVNGKFMEFKCNIPKDVSFLEPQLRAEINKKYKRGTVDLKLRYVDQSKPVIKINEEKLNVFAEVIHQVMKACKTDTMPLEYVLREYDIIEYRNKIAENPLFAKDIMSTLSKAIKIQQKGAKKEGLSIKKHILVSIERISEAVNAIEATIPNFRKELFEKMKSRIVDLLPQSTNINLEQRLMQELAIYLDRYDIQEEINRLKEHVDTLHKTIEDRAANDIGKTLNFVFQEMQRESNTLGSKYSNQHSFSNILLIKEEIEKCREIIQNVM